MNPTLMPARAISPGSIIKRELTARGWTQKDLAGILGRPAQAVSEIVRGTKQITPDTAAQLAAAFGTSEDFWSNLEADYRRALARQSSQSTDDVARKARLYDMVPVRELQNRGWITAGDRLTDLEHAVCSFLGVSHVGEEPALSVSLRHSSDGSEKAAQRAWVKRVEHLSATQDVGPFNASHLRDAMPTLRKEAATEKGVARVPLMLKELGVRFVVVPHLPRTKLDGAAAFTSNGPVVALTMRYDRIDYFWFTMLHELAHLVLEHRGGHLDGEVEDGDVDEEEAAANETASGWLFRDSEVRAFFGSPFRASGMAVEDFGRRQAVHPGIVVGRLHHMKLLPYAHLRRYLVRVSASLRAWTDPVATS